MRPKLEQLVDRAFAGMGWRPFYLVSVGSLALVAYTIVGRKSAPPSWFVAASRALTGIESLGFHRHGWAHLSALVILMLVPLLVSYWGERWGPRFLGLSLRGSAKEFVVVTVLWLLFVPVIYIAAGTPSFAKTYPRLRAIETDAALFVAYQAYYLVKWTAWEFFFRGFLLFGLWPDMRGRAVLVSTIAFTAMHAGKPPAELLGSFFAGLILCFIAYRGRSIWPGVFLHSMVATTMDFFGSSFWR